MGIDAASSPWCKSIVAPRAPGENDAPGPGKARRPRIPGGTRWNAGLVAAALVCTTVSAQAQEASSTRIDGLVRKAARRFAQVGQPPDPRPPATAGGQQTADQPMRSLTLDDAVKLALERNLDIAVQRSNPEAFDLELASLKATYLPTV